jgi:hypothetical protein
MKIRLQLTVTKDCHILCRLFRCRVEDLLLYYMQQVNIEQLAKGRATKEVECATWLFLSQVG